MTNVWKGGTPGDENNWSNPRNWQSQEIPDYYHKVIIPNLSTTGNHYPIISTTVDPIASLTIEGGAKLIIYKKGQLLVDGKSVIDNGILNYGDIFIEGQLLIENIALDYFTGNKQDLNFRLIDNDSKGLRIRVFTKNRLVREKLLAFVESAKAQN